MSPLGHQWICRCGCGYSPQSVFALAFKIGRCPRCRLWSFLKRVPIYDDGGTLFCIFDSTGHADHTTIRASREEAIKEFLSGEGNMTWLGNLFAVSKGRQMTHPKSWELYEADGYRCEPVMILKL